MTLLAAAKRKARLVIFGHQVPTPIVVTLGFIAGVLAILNETTFDFSPEWRTYVSVALIFLTGLGISPLTGPSMRAALHLSQPVALAISTVLGALALSVHTFGLAPGVRGAVQGVITFGAAIGFAPDNSLPALPSQAQQVGLGLKGTVQ